MPIALQLIPLTLRHLRRAGSIPYGLPPLKPNPWSAGLNAAHAANIVAYRKQHGPFQRRKDLLKVPKVGKVTFERAAGFLRIPNGPEPLDDTGVHPERYAVVQSMAATCGLSVKGMTLPSSNTHPQGQSKGRRYQTGTTSHGCHVKP